MTTAILFGIVAVLWVIAMSRPGRLHVTALSHARDNLAVLVLRIPLAIVASSFLAELLPSEAISAWLGSDSGMSGILIASAIGFVLPGGPPLSFPLAAALMVSGAGTPQMVALLTAWAILNPHRLVAWELPVVGVAYAWRRAAIGMPLAPLSGLFVLLVGAP